MTCAPFPPPRHCQSAFPGAISSIAPRQAHLQATAQQLLVAAMLTLAAYVAISSGDCAAASSGDYALQLRGEYMHAFIDARPWQSLYFNAPVNGGGLTLDSELAVGVGPYLRVDWLNAARDIPGGIHARWGLTEGALGVNYRIHPLSWFAPGAHVGWLYLGANETISDNTFAYKMRHDGSGLDVGVDLDFYPIQLKYDSWARGWGLWLGAGYQSRPLAGMAGLTNASGWSLGLGLEYRFDLTPRPTPPPAPSPTVSAPPPPPGSGQ